ncbi:FAM207A [Branchiostoma lanceolatum]|uniref:FAM207A protein n=1 Tax=Branchiostoma lanceolatum TaxID=7740 RepID=A0A8J9Z9S4_BRALA|nr:FAM207A [Branchiostoma lanceolatum]
MGKIKRVRQKYHTAAVKLGSEGEGKLENPPQTTKLPSLPLPAGTPVFPTSGLFDGADLTDPLAPLSVAPVSVEQDRQSIVSGRSIRTEGGTRISKKDKRKMRHDVFLQKLEAAHTAKKRAKETKRRQQTAVVGDMQPLKDALPQLTAFLEQQQGGAAAAQEEKKEKGGSLKPKERKRIEQEELSRFQQILQHPQYRQRPVSTIMEHLRNKLSKEQDRN